ncbi:IST1 homolog isoform X5 [Myotis myotis]|uniref:IST1 homolog isoform X5 n=1 Tax=Myotis myotis TaxID=51298 RepID=UPI001749FD45|nr:IST1 homolog isoform X5 [Myotis myotis]
MFGSVFKADRLRVNLQLVVNRLKLLERKKTEQAQKARKEVADHLAAGKDERARIRVEHIIREDYLVEAMEILELYCNLLLARFGLIQATKELDSGLAESVSTLIWAAPRLQSEVPELKIAEAPADLVSVGFTEEDKKGTLDGGGGTVAGPGDPVWASPISAPEPLPVRSPVPCFSSLPPGRQRGRERDRELDTSMREKHGPATSRTPPTGDVSATKNDSFKNDLHPILVPGPGFNPQTSPKPASRTEIGFDNFMLPDLPDVKPQASLSIDPYDSEEIDFEDLDRRLEMLKKTT